MTVAVLATPSSDMSMCPGAYAVMSTPPAVQTMPSMVAIPWAFVVASWRAPSGRSTATFADARGTCARSTTTIFREAVAGVVGGAVFAEALGLGEGPPPEELAPQPTAVSKLSKERTLRVRWMFISVAILTGRPPRACRPNGRRSSVR